MQRLLFWLTCFYVFMLVSIAATAAPQHYFVEIGGQFSEAEARKEWQSLKNRHRTALADLQFYPVNSGNDDNDMPVIRMHVGPFPARLDAYRVCSELIDHNVSCAIAEGANHTVDAAPEPKSSRVSAKDPDMVNLPWLSDTPVLLSSSQDSTATGEVDDSFSLIGWLFGSDSEKEANTPSALADKEGEVEVAEAIHVPLTRDSKRVLLPQFDKPVSPAPSKLPVLSQIEQDESAKENAFGWLNVGNFASDAQASEFWKTVRDSDPVPVAGLRVRITRPLMERAGKSQVSLNLGPFADRKDAMAFCHATIQSKNSALSCNFIQKGPEEVVARQVAPRFSQAQRYEQRRKAMDSRGRKQDRYFGSRTPPKVYWVQVAARNSHVEAIRAWEELKTQHADLLGDKRSNISAALMHEARFMVRVGPLEHGEEATKLCASLTGRGVPCRIYSNM